jgi:hypothetical protein
MFFRKTKTGIRIIKIYDDIRMKDEIISAPPKQTTKTLNHIKENPKRYAYQTKKKDQLFGIPKIKISTLSEPEHVKEHDINIVAEITYTYTTVVTPHKTNPFIALLVILLIWSCLGGVILMFMGDNMAKQTRIDSQCYYYMKEGVPQSITVEGTKYKLNKNGTLNAIDKEFFNPYHRQIIEEDGCVEINTRR